VRLEGNCSQDRVREFYRETDLFVLPSEAEGIPVVLMEAMAMEIPCVATRITGIPELIRHGEEGWLVPSGNEAELVAAIAQLMDHPELRERLGRAARQRVMCDYDLAKNVEQLAAIFRRRLAENVERQAVSQAVR
jgi:glycosyltransferase involved in cell wall biosynthesis